MAAKAEASKRGELWRLASLVVALALLNASLAFRNLWPTPAVRWNGDISVELAAALMLLVLASLRFGLPTRRVVGWLSAGWVLLVMVRYADVTAPALYGREVNLYWDAPRLGAVAAMLVRPAAWWLVLLILSAAVVLPPILFVVLRAALARVGEAVARAGERRALGLLAAAALLIFAVQHLDPRVPAIPRFSQPVIATLARQARLVTGEMMAARTNVGAAPASLPADLSRVHGADVFLVFIESYGAVSYDRAEFAAGLAASRMRLLGDIRAAGRDVVSAFVESPTFGGSSWLAHVSLLSGVEVRDEDTNVRLMAGKRDTLVTAFARRGYRTVAVMPGLHSAWPEGAFYGFNEVYDEARLDYRGPPFGWWSIPDQFALARMDALEVSRPSRAPLFVFYPTTNTHTPFSPTPPYQPDWPRVLTDQPFDEPALVRAWDQTPDWLNLGPGFVQALSYTYETIGSYLRLRADRDFVMILLGDHQPPAAVSGEGATWEVPIHVIASRREILDSLLGQGFQRGLAPRHPPIARMHALLPILLSAFSASP